MIDNSKEYVICAAIWYKDGKEYPRGMFAQNLNTDQNGNKTNNQNG